MPDESVPSERARLPLYERPGDGEPLDAVQTALVRMWVDIIADEMQKELAANPEAFTATAGLEIADARKDQSGRRPGTVAMNVASVARRGDEDNDRPGRA